MQAIEEVHRERQLGAHALDVELAAEAAHRHLERQRRAVGGERDGLAVEDQLLRGQRLQRLDDLGRRRGDVLQRARVDLDLAARLVHLHARAVDLPFERRGAELGHRARRCRRPASRASAAPAGAARRRSGRGRPRLAFAFGKRHPRDLAEAAGDHRRAAHVGGRQPGGGGDRVEHHALERALAQLADEQADEEVLLGGGGAIEEGAQGGAARRGRALAGGGRDGGERGVGLAQRQPRLGRGRAAQRRQRRPADADPALPRLAGEPGDGDLDLVGRGAAQHFGDRVALGEPARGRGGASGGVDEGGEEGGHRLIFDSAVACGHE